jgi:DNA-binding MarR family transcriptional regulator
LTPKSGTKIEMRRPQTIHKPATVAGLALAELGWTIFDIYFRMKGPAERVICAPYGQTMSRYSLLCDIALRGPSSVARIAKSRGTARQAIQRLADELTAEGVVEFIENPAHARSKLLSLTPHGRALTTKIGKAEARVWDEVAQTLDPRELRAATRVLKHYQRRIQEWDELARNPASRESRTEPVRIRPGAPS